MGAPLTSAQIGALTTDIVWLVDMVVDGQEVLTPVVYLSQATANHLKANGALIAGDQVAIQSSTTLSNAGSISSDHGTWLSADTLINTGAINSGGLLAIATAHDTINSGTLSAQSLAVQAGRDLITTGLITSSGDMALTAGRDLTTGVAPIQAGGNLSMVAGRNLTATASTIGAGGDAQLVAGNNLSLNATAKTTRSEVGQTTQENLTYTTTSVSAGGNLALVAGNNLTSQGAQLTAGNQLALAAGNDITLNAVTNAQTVTSQTQQGHTRTHTSAYDESVQGTTLNGTTGVVATAGHDLTATAATISSANGNVALGASHDLTLNAAQENHSVTVDTVNRGGGMLSKSKTTTHDVVSDSDVVGTAISGNNVSLAAGHDLTAQAAQVSASGAIYVTAGNDIHLTTAQNVHSEEHDKTTKKSGAIIGGAGEVTYQGKKTSSTQTTQQSDAVGTTLSGDTVTMAAGHDLTAAAAQIAGTHDVTLAAGHDLTLTTADSTCDASSSQSKTTTGYMRSGIDVTIGKQTNGATDSLHQSTPTGTLVGSTDGSVTISAGHNVLVHGSDVISQTGTTIVGANVIIDAAMGSTDATQAQSQSTGGVTAGLGGVVGNLAHAIYNDEQGATHTNDPRLKALYAAQAAYQTKDALTALGSDNATEAQGGGINLQVGIGGSHASSSTTTHDESAVGSQINSAGNVTIAALDDGTVGSGNLSVIGSTVSGNNVTLAAANHLLLQSQAEQHTDTSRNENTSAGVGLQIGTDGVGFYAQASAGKGNAHGNGTTHDDTNVTAANTLTLISGGDTTIQGAQATGKTVLANIGGNLNIASEQDTDDYASKQQQVSGKVVIGYGSSASGSYSQSKVDSHYAGVNTVSGIGAGSGGYQIHVNGNTDLKGAVIASTADPSNNLLDTGSLSFSNINNVSKYSAESFSVSGGSSGGSGTGSISGSVPQNKDEHSTTEAGIANGTIITRNGDTDLSGLNRDPSLDTQALKNSFNLQKIQTDQQIGQVAGYVGMHAVGDIKQMNPNGGTTQAVLLHGIVGAATAALGGGNAVGGALGAGASEAASNGMQQYLLSQHIDPNSPEGKNLMQMGSASIGAAVGGGSGAVTALDGEQYNRQLHRNESVWISANAEKYAEQHPGMTTDQAEAALAQQAYRQVQSGAAGTWDADASAFLKTAGRDLWTDPNYPGQTFVMYQADSFAQKQDTTVFANAKDVDVNFYSKNGLQPVTSDQAAAWEAMRISATKTAAEQAAVIGGSSVLSPAISAYAGAAGTSTVAAFLAGRAGAGIIGGATNAAFQLAGDQPFNPFSTGVAVATGVLGAGRGVIANVAINASGGAANAYLNNTFYGSNDNLLESARNAGAFALLGYSAGYGATAGYAKYQSLSPSARLNAQDWTPMGMGMYAPSSPPSAAYILSNISSAFSQESSGVIYKQVTNIYGK